MNWKETFEFAENLMMQEVMNSMQDDIDEYGSEYYGDLKTFDAVKFSSDSHYNDETTELIVSDMTLYLNGEELDLSDIDYYDLIFKMSDRYPRLVYCCDKLFVRENGQKISDSFDCENVAHIVNQYKELQNLAKVKLQEYVISNQQDWYGVHDISFDESYVYGSVEVQAGFSTAIKNYKMPIEFLGLS